MTSEDESSVEVALEGAVAHLTMSFRGRLNLVDAREGMTALLEHRSPHFED